MSKELELFKELFQETPNLAVLHISNNCDIVSKSIEEVVSSSDGHLKYIDLQTEDITKFKPNAREYEYVILSNIGKTLDDKKKFFAFIYRSIENSGNIIILEDKTNVQELDNLKALLENSQFVAVNDIELFDKYFLVTAKKMHMWGNGL